MQIAPGTLRRIPLHERPEIQSRRWFLLGIMCLSLVLVVMAVSGLNTALPTMQQDLGASASALQWIVDSYAVLFAGLLLTAGAIGDRFGRKRALIGGSWCSPQVP
jgi:MFS family permease